MYIDSLVDSTSLSVLWIPQGHRLQRIISFSLSIEVARRSLVSVTAGNRRRADLLEEISIDDDIL